MPQTVITLPLLATGGNTAGFEIPEEVVQDLGGGKKPKVTITLNDGHSYRSSIAVMGGRYMLGVSAANRQAAGIAAGDEVKLALDLDTGPREVDIPVDLMESLNANRDVRAAFDKLSYTQRRQHVLGIEEAKTPETRARRIARTVSMIIAGKK